MAIEAVNTIASNITAERAARILTDSTLLLQKSLLRLSSGLKITSAGDDPGGSAQAISLQNQIARIGAAQTNVTNATSFSETQDGFIDDVQTALDRMGELAVLSSDGLTTSTERSDYQIEFSQLQAYVSDVGTKTFNGIALFSSTDLDVTIDGDGNKFTMNGLNYSATLISGGLFQAYATGSTSVGTAAAAASALTTVSLAMDNLSFFKAQVGGNVARLDLTSGDLTALSENLDATKSLITDTNIATETVEFSRLQLLVNSGTAMLAQANAQPLNLLDLLDFNN